MPTSLPRILAIACAIGLVGVWPAAAQEQRPTFRSSARLVQVSVVVHDRDGRTVPGLTAEDFQIVERGKTHPVAHFAVDTDSALRPPPLAGGEAAAFTNVLDGRVGTGATILLFDRVNTRDIDRHWAIRQVIKFLLELRPDDRIGFYVLDSDRIRIIHDFTRDASSLIALVKETDGLTSTERAGSDDRLPPPADPGDGLQDKFEGMVRLAEERMQAHYIRARTNVTASAFEALAQRLAGVKGRKNVIWLSSAFPLYFPEDGWIKNMGDVVYRATRALSHSDITIYPVDAGGLQGAFAGHVADKVKVFTTMRTQHPSFAASEVVAEQTGGRVFRNTNDLRTAIQQAAEDANLTYVLGYYPTDDRWDGRFRRISVKVGRKGVSVRHRSGYYAHPPQLADTAFKQTGLVEALRYPIESTGLGLTVRVVPANGPGQIGLAVTIDPTALSLEQQEGRWRGQLEVAIAQQGAGERLYSTLHVTVPLDVGDEMRPALLAQGVTLSRSITLQPDAWTVVVGVRDLRSGAIGTVRLDVTRLKQPSSY